MSKEATEEEARRCLEEILAKRIQGSSPTHCDLPTPENSALQAVASEKYGHRTSVTSKQAEALLQSLEFRCTTNPTARAPKGTGRTYTKIHGSRNKTSSQK